MRVDVERIIHSFKTGLACLIGFGLIQALHSYLMFDQWLIVTILVVMCAQISVGSIFYKSILRFIGTCLGSLLAAFTIIAFGNDTLVFALVIALSGVIFSYIATGQKNYSDAGTLGAVTTAIILINPTPTLSLTLERFIEITLGILIATLISQFIMPIHARKHLRRSQAFALRLLGDYYRQAISTSTDDKELISRIDDKIVQSLSTQRKLAKDAKQELLGSKFEPEIFKKVMDLEKGILRSIDFMNRLTDDSATQKALDKLAEWQTFNKAILAVFDELSKQAEDPPSLAHPIKIPSLKHLKEQLSEKLNSGHSNMDQTYAFFFCLETLTEQLKALAAVIH